MAGYNFIPQYPYMTPQVNQYYQGTPQIQNGGFIPVKSIEEAYNWAVAPGNSITFKDENAPYVYTKTKGFSPLEPAVFEKYRLVKEDDAVKPVETALNAPEQPEFADEINRMWQ